MAHTVHAYEHDPSAEAYGSEAADALGLDPGQVFKTLVARQADGTHVVAVVPVAGRLDLKALARAAGTKSTTMADPGDAERITGYVVGGISPFGQRRRLATFVDTSAEALGSVFVSAGRRGVEIELAPADLMAVLDGRLAPIGGR